MSQARDDMKQDQQNCPQISELRHNRHFAQNNRINEMNTSLIFETINTNAAKF
jgi:hypothetical protein